MSDIKNQAQHPLFTVIFEDGSNFIGGTDYFKTKWLEIPDKKIKRIFYKLPTNDYICLDGYEKYFHMVEATKDWAKIGKNKIEIIKDLNKPKIEYAYIMGKLKDKVISYRVTLSNKKDDRFRIGDITMRIFNINDEKIKGLNPNNWK